MSVTPEEIYEAYPRKDKKVYSIKHIFKAIKRIWKEQGFNSKYELAPPAEYLLSRVKVYAISRAGKDKRFTPHCSTWMNQERYHDDTADWFDGQSEDDRKNRADLGESETVVQTD